MISDNTVLSIANHLINTNTTIRQCAVEYGISRSYVHVLMHRRLPKLSKSLYIKVCDLFEYNLKQRAIRGGNSTYEKYGAIAYRRKQRTK